MGLYNRTITYPKNKRVSDCQMTKPFFRSLTEFILGLKTYSSVPNSNPI